MNAHLRGPIAPEEPRDEAEPSVTEQYVADLEELLARTEAELRDARESVRTLRERLAAMEQGERDDDEDEGDHDEIAY